VNLFGTGMFCTIPNSSLLYFGNTTWNSYNNSPAAQCPNFYSFDKCSYHPLGNFKICNHTVTHRTDDSNFFMFPALHFFGFISKCNYSFRIFIKSND